ncbi:MAG: hypothetical protein ACI81T_003557 [Bacteroidia bacterium]
MANRSFVDSTNVYVFGHSIIGGRLALLTLNKNCSSRLNGSFVRIYFGESLSGLVGKENITFDTSNENEYLSVVLFIGYNYLSKKVFHAHRN